MYRTLQQRVLASLQATIQQNYQIELPHLPMEQPPRIELGELAIPVAFELAKRLKRAPKVIAAELAEVLKQIDGVRDVEVAGAGYLNLRFDRAAVAADIASGKHALIGGPGFRLVEHTSINPNKAAHVGHLRNAILGDTFQRLLRNDSYKQGFGVGVQNYIDNTGVQVADIVVALTELEKMSLADVRALLTKLQAKGERVDYFMWDLYAHVSQWYTADPALAESRKQLRLATLHDVEAGSNERADIAELVSTAVLHRHLETMQRLGIEYDFLPRESEILHLNFWDAARTLMIERGVLYEVTEGKNKGCWVMRRPESTVAEGEMDEDAKVIIRSNGTVTYVGKDIAYHLWKFGLLPGKDFGYTRFHEYPAHTCWISTSYGDDPHPTFGKADWIYNVIDSRQNDPQANVMEALRGMGYAGAADHYVHLNYAMVALTPRCAMDLGYAVSEEDQKKQYLEVSGRKGFGVKADDLIDQLIAAAKVEVDKRHPELSDGERMETATTIAVGALRYFMLKFTRNTVIAFDLREALSFEGETGPYVQYSIVRASNILRKSGVDADAALADVDFSAHLEGEENNVIWEIWMMASRLTIVLAQSIDTAEPAHLARYAFQLAQAFNNFYHRHPVLQESDETRRKLLLATAAVARRDMVQTLKLLGIGAPAVM